MRSRNVLYSLISSVILQLILTFSNFWVINLMIVTYGSEVNGLNATIQQIINYIFLVEVGIALTAIQALYKPLAQNNWRDINGILSATKQLYIKSGFFFVGILLFICFIFPYLLDTEIPNINISILLFVMAGGSIVEFFLNGKLRVLLMGDQKSYVVNLFQILYLLVSTLLKVILINTGFHYIIVQAVGVLAVLIRYYFTKFYILRKYPLLSYNEKPINDSLKNRWSVLYHQISGLIVFGSPVIIVSIFIGLKEASVYAIYNIVFSALIMIITMFSKSTVASFGNLLSTVNSDKVKSIFFNYQILFFSFGTWLYTVAYVMVDPFITLYTSGVDDIVYNDKLLAILFIIIGILNIFRVPNNTLIEASGHYKQTRNRAITEAIINLTASLIFVEIFGIYGVLLGSLCSYLYRSLDIVFYSSKHILGISPMITFRLFTPGLITGVLSVMIITRLVNFKIDTWYYWILSTSVLSLIVGILILGINSIIHKDFRKDLCKRINSLLGRSKVKLNSQ